MTSPFLVGIHPVAESYGVNCDAGTVILNIEVANKFDSSIWSNIFLVYLNGRIGNKTNCRSSISIERALSSELRQMFKSYEGLTSGDNGSDPLQAIYAMLKALIIFIVGAILFKYGLGYVNNDSLGVLVALLGFGAITLCFVFIFQAACALHLVDP